MKLTLTVEKSEDPKLEGLKFSFDEQGGSLGRSADNDWVLPDPQFYTSGRHAQVSFENGGFVLTDTSTNGTFHNSPERLIGKNRTANLADGDQLYVGEFVLRVSLDQDRPDATDGASTATPTAEATGGWSGEPVDDDWPAENPDSDFWPEEDKEGDDSSRGAVSSLPWERESSADSLLSDTGFLDDDEESESSFSGSDFQQSPEKEHFSPPRASSEAKEAIPDDWDDLLTGFFEPQARSDAESIPEEPESPPEPEPPAQPGPSANPQSPPDPEPARDRPATPPPARQAPPAPRAASGGDPIYRIMQELGIEASAGEVDPEEFAAEIGKVVRLLGEGLMQLLASRAEIKNEFRIDQTRMAQVDNNPLKFSPTIEEAMRRIFVRQKSDGFTGGVDSFEQALNDLRAHQIAILAAVQGSIESAIRQFNPEQLEQKLKKISPISAAAPWIRDAKCWNLFTVHYDEVAGRLRDDAKRVFIREFAEAYERSSSEIARQIREGEHGKK